MTCNIECLLPVIMLLSIIVIVDADVKSTHVVCPHNKTCDLCIFVICSKSGFVDIVPLCCKLLIYKLLLKPSTWLLAEILTT